MEFPKTYTPESFENEIYERTEKFFSPTEEGKVYTITMPPPNITGSLHLGHALTYTIQDILIRFHRQGGGRVLWQPGTDHAGIATQMVAEKALEARGLRKSDLSRTEFINEVWKWKESSGGAISYQQRRLGCSADWKRARFTMDDGMSKAVIRAFVTLYNDGLIYRDKRLINWDTKLKTAISDLEIINKEEKGTLWHIKYQIDGSSDFVVVATTRPETMFGDTAIAVHPDDKRYQSLVGKMAVIPFSGRKVQIIADEYADMTKGSGCVKITPAHDYNDFSVGKRHNLDMICILDEDGHMLDCEYVPSFLSGLYLKKARNVLLEKLASDNLLVKEEEITHSIPYADRSNVVVEPMLKEQWFVDAPCMAPKALQAVVDGDSRFFPNKWANTYYDWMNNIEPWCISRQIIWGHQIPAWFGPNGEIFVEETEEKVAELAAAKGITMEQLTRDPDVLDTWFSSSLWPFSALGWPEETRELADFFPTNVLVTGFDIIFFWVARMMMMSLYFMKKPPFKDIYIHALVRDEKGQKMSKSKGNVLDPICLMDEYGTDALRFTLAFFSVPGRDIKIGREHVKTSRNFITKIWNAARFLHYKNVPFSKEQHDIVPQSVVNKWILVKLAKFQKDFATNINEYRFDYATRNMQFFLRDTFCDFFVETMKINDDDETKRVAGFVFTEFLRISHPIIPFITDHLASILSISDTFIDSPPHGVVESDFEEAEKEVDAFIEVLHRVRGGGDCDTADNVSEELRKFLVL